MQRVITVCMGVIICSLGLSLYQSARVGVAPYDSLPMILADRYPQIPYLSFRLVEWVGGKSEINKIVSTQVL